MALTDDKPRTRAELDRRIERRFGFEPGYASAASVMAAAVIARLLPCGSVKGGSALRLRYGVEGTRFTNDVDIARVGSEGEFRDALAKSLRDGWEGFSGTLEELPNHVPDGLQQRYAMVPYLVRLSYRGQSWADVRVEISHNELGDADEPDLVDSPEVSELFECVGLSSPGALPLMRLGFQVAQKLHALSDKGSERAHDLVDLQLIIGHPGIDVTGVGNICARLFAYRKAQEWTPRIAHASSWENMYDFAAEGLDVLGTAEEATEWANNLIDTLNAGSPSQNTTESLS